jgi:pyruvate/2-oxoglutarate dehydrogenase complex dihydrolipoamide dehydrogenase (E3) component
VEKLKPDFCIIGAGPGGMAVAMSAAAFGVPAVIVEKGRMGGSDLHSGSVPSKALAGAAKHAWSSRVGTGFGLVTAHPDFDPVEVSRHVGEVVGRIASNSTVERLAAMGLRVVLGEAQFRDRKTLVAGDCEIQARRFVIATGSSPVMPHIPGLEDVEHFFPDAAFAQQKRLPHPVIIGAGATGLELAQSYRRLGCEVSVIEAYYALGREDPEMAAVVLRALRAEGVTILENAKIQGVEKRAKGGVRVFLAAGASQRVVDGSHIILAAGRRPNVEDIGLEKARVAFDRRTGIAVGPDMRTSNSHIFAIGDVIGGHCSAHRAVHQAGLVMRQALLRQDVGDTAQLVPRVVMTDPELATVGLSEEEAATKYGKLRVLRWPYSENDRARAERRTEGHIKIVADRKGKLLGASIAGANAAEMIGFWTLAVGKEMTIADVSAVVPPYPTMSEVGHSAAVAYLAAAAARPAVRGLVRLLSRFG